jgi:glycosyltransferase involved in cell wall biosynthesis
MDRYAAKFPTDHPLVRVLWEQTVQPWLLRRYQIALVHGLAFALPLLSSCPMIVTVYDLAFYRLPHYFRPWNRLYLKLATRLSTQRADYVIAISQSTKDELVHVLGVTPEKITVVAPGKSEEMQPLDDVDAVTVFRRRRKLPERMIFYLGTLEPRKNLVALLRAYALLRDMASSVPTLVLGGAKGWYYEEIFAAIEQLGLENDVLLPGYIPGDELLWWYNAADCFVYPSLYEGFGLPVLEAMACGTPVVTSNAAALPEVVGDAGLTVPPDDVERLAQAIYRTLYDDDWRRQAIQEGIRQAAKFSWSAAAQHTADLYAIALGMKGQG